MSTARALPHRLLAFYGDDFTGSTDVMDVAARAGLAAVLFLRTPDEALLAQFADARVVGIAGISRSQTPAWMGEHLPAIFRSLAATGAPFVHYKVCSTFDSAPHVGSIGAAARIGLELFENRPVPVAVGAPALRRYVAFGNLFAGSGEARYRIDRHPVMARHPVTPMGEADLRTHLRAQAELSVGLVDLPLLDTLDADTDWVAGLGTPADLLLFDTVDENTLRRVGALIWSRAGARPAFAIGSSGFEYALVAAWRAAGLLAPPPVLASPAPAERIFALSGSCSPVTARQIQHALGNGFAGLHVEGRALVDGQAAIDRAIADSLALLETGRDVLLYTASEPGHAIAPSGTPADTMAFNDRLGAALGDILLTVLRRSGVRRAVVSGGDTSSHATRRLELEALTVAAPLAPGCPLCHALAAGDTLHGLEIALKGGQMGQDDFFSRATGRVDDAG